MRTERTRNTKLSEGPGAIVLGDNFRGLGIVRSLGRSVPVWVVDTEPSVAQSSRFTDRFAVNDGNTVNTLLRIGNEFNLKDWVVFPTYDGDVETISKNHQELSTIYKLTTPPWETTEIALDKRLTYEKAKKLGIATPFTEILTGPSLADIEKLPYPVILKPAIGHHFFGQAKVKALQAENAEQFLVQYEAMKDFLPNQQDQIMVQEKIPGGGENQFSFAAVCEDGDPYATLVAQRRRQHPIDFGINSSFVETVEQPVVERDGRKFLEAIGYDGMGEVEFKYDPRDEQYKLLDVNMRAWGWHTLGKIAGVDFSQILWQQKMGNERIRVHSKTGAAWMRETTDLWVIAQSPDRWKEFQTLMRRNMTFAVFDSSDPMPFLADIVSTAKRKLGGE